MISPINSTTPEIIRPPIPLILGSVDSPQKQIDETKQIIHERKTFEDLKQLVKMEIEKCAIDTELDILQKTLQSDPSITDRYCNRVTSDLYSILSPLSPERIDLFGSTVMGVSFQGSDLDFYIGTEETQDMTGLLRRVHHYLATSKKFSDFQVICNARVPIVKCFHIESGFQCDINFASNIGVYNSRIMAHLLRFDSRIHALVILIKFWMKCHNLTGPKSITSYTILWLVIFYVQQLETPLLPPIEVFQRDVPDFYIGAVNLSFNFTLPNLLAKNVDGIATLLHGFFVFYAHFDFGSQLISPLHGRAFPRHNFEKMFPHHFARYRETLTLIPTAEPMRFGKPICIQDPFEICRSIPGKLNGLYYPTFHAALNNAAQICQENLTTTGGSKELLLTLFNSDLILPKEPANYRIATVNDKTNMNITIIATAKELNAINKYVQRNYLIASKEDIKQLWAKLCMSFLEDMFQYIFAFQLENQKVDNSVFSKSFDMFSTSYGVFSKRKPMLLPVPDIDVEKKRTKRKLKKGGKTLEERLGINCRFWADLGNDLRVFVSFMAHDSNLLINSFYEEFQKRARLLITAYFARQKFNKEFVKTKFSYDIDI